MNDVYFRTNKYISEIYRDYDGSLPEENCQRYGGDGNEQREDDDDFLMDQSPARSAMFTYSTSPGFMQS